MKHIWITSAVSFSMLFLAAGFLTGCFTYTITAKDVSDHLGNFPPGEELAIDGTWKDAWGNEFEMEAGRMYTEEVYPQVHYHHIERVAPGKYKAQSSYVKSNYTISIVGEDKIIIRESSYDQVLTCIDLAHPDKFEEEFNVVKQEMDRPKIVVRGLSCVPRKMKPEMPFSLKCTYFLQRSDTSADTVPLTLSYQISEGNKVLFRSKPNTMSTPNRAESQRVVHLTASPKEGAYCIEVHLQSGSLSATDSCEFIIDRRVRYPDDRPLIDRLVGRYGNEGDNQTGTIVLFKEGNSLAAEYVPPPGDRSAEFNVKHTFKVVALHEDRLVMLLTTTMKDEYSVMDDTTIWEWTVDLTDPFLEELPVKLKVLKSSFMGMGMTSRGLMKRIDDW